MKKLLLVRTSSMGDLIHTLPAINDLATACPNLQLTWLCEESFTDIARLHPFVKNIIPMALRRWRKSWWKSESLNEYRQLKQQLQAAQFDYVLDAQGLVKSAYFARLSGVPVWGLDRASAREPWSNLFYQKTFSVPKGQMAVLRNRQLFAQAFDYRFEELVAFGARVPEDVFLDIQPNTYMVFLHATSRENKLWLESYWRELAIRVHRQYGVMVYFPWGTEQERVRAEQLTDGLAFSQVCSKMSLLEAAYLMQHAKCVVGVDTGLLHLANAFPVPLIGIYTDTDPKLTGVVETQYAQNIGGIGMMPTVDEVWRTVGFLLESGRICCG